ncbi:MAG: hypothetical protein HZB68_00330 [Candidatus Aenigmarchaeota archaeon]|nr:hypothetical protein [Candidatus Aenigmarchaeota archaeon]
MYSLATNDTSDPKFFFALTGSQPNMPIEMYNSTFGYIGQCSTGRSSFSGLDVVNNTFYTWYGKVPASFPNNNPYLGSSIYMFNRDCSVNNSIHLNNQNGRTAFSHNRTHLFTVSGGLEIFDFSEILYPNRPPLVPPKATCGSGGSDIHAHPDGSFWSVEAGGIYHYYANCTRQSSFTKADLGISGGNLRGIVSNDLNSLVWVSQAGGTVYEFSVNRDDIVSLQNYPYGSNITLYGNQANQLKFLVSPKGNYTIYPVYPNGTRVHYNTTYNNVQMVWNSHSETGYSIKEDAFNGNKSFAYFTIIHKGSNYNSTSARFVVEENGKIVGTRNFTLSFIQVPENGTAKYYQRFNPEDHIFGIENATHPSLSFDYRNTSLEVHLGGVSIANLTGDVDDLADALVYGPHESPEYATVFSYGNHWVVRLWFGWFADGSDVAPDQFPDLEMLDIWADKNTLKSVYVQSFIHSGSWWFKPNENKGIIIGDNEHLFLDLRELTIPETHTPSPNDHTGLYYAPWLPFIGPLHHIDPTNSEYHTDVIHTAGSENAFGFFEMPRPSINTYISISPNLGMRSPTAYYVAPGTELNVLVTVANDGSAHDTIVGIEPDVSLTVTRTAFLPGRFPVDIDATIGNKFGPIASEPLFESDVPAGRGASVTFMINSTDDFVPVPDIIKPSQVTSLFAKAKVGNITDVDYAIIIPKYLNGSVSLNNFMGTIRQLKTDLHSFFIEKGAYPAAVVLYLNWFGSDLDMSITDPSGRRISFNRTTGNLTSEIPGANYSGPYSQPETITVPNATDGNWTIEVLAVEVNDSEPYVVSATVINMTEETTTTTTTTLPEPTLNSAPSTVSSGGDGSGLSLPKTPKSASETNITKPPEESAPAETGTISLQKEIAEPSKEIEENKKLQTPTGRSISPLPGMANAIVMLLVVVTIFVSFKRFL